jgi:cold-inducible RNA-binding protein
MEKKLYAGNLPYSATDASLTELFSTAGEVVSAKVITDMDSGRSKGFGFVEMANTDGAKKAIEQLDNTELDGRKIRVSEAKPKSESRSGGRGSFSRGNNSNRW